MPWFWSHRDDTLREESGLPGRPNKQIRYPEMERAAKEVCKPLCSRTRGTKNVKYTGLSLQREKCITCCLPKELKMEAGNSPVTFALWVHPRSYWTLSQEILWSDNLINLKNKKLMSQVLGKSLKDQRSRGAVAVASDLSSSNRAKILSLPRLTTSCHLLL